MFCNALQSSEPLIWGGGSKNLHRLRTDLEKVIGIPGVQYILCKRQQMHEWRAKLKYFIRRLEETLSDTDRDSHSPVIGI